METKTSNEIFTENAKLASNSINNLSSAILEIYKKQLDTGFDFYNNFFNAITGFTKKNTFNNGLDFSNLFLNGNGVLKSALTPFAWPKYDGEHTSPFLSMAYENFYALLNEYNKNWVNSIQKNMHLQQSDWLNINKKYMQERESRLESIKNIADTFTNANNKQFDFSIDSNKNLFAELNEHFSKAIKSNTDFWENILKTYETTVKEEAVKKTEKQEMVAH